MELKTCPECGVPEIITGEHRWLDNGDIVQRRAQQARILFIEIDNMDPLFRNVGQIIGMDIEPIVITSARRALRIYLDAFVPGDVKELIRSRQIDYQPIVGLFFDIAALDGVGGYELVDVRQEGDEQDHAVVRIKGVHSVPLSVAHIIGATESLTGIDQGYRYEEVSPGEIQITVFPSPHPKGMKKRMRTKAYEHREGDVYLESCDTCGGPEKLSDFRWQMEEGIIVDTSTSRRMSIFGDAELDPVFEELEWELGDTVPRAVVEAQRRFTKGGFYNSDDLTDEDGFRTQLALRGMGNLKHLEMKRKGMLMHLENAALPLMIVGQAQGFYEMGFGVDTTVIWELSEDGDLDVEVKPLRSRS
jgi:hypothetical protein